MALSRIATVLGGLLISKGGRRFAGRHAGKLALATLAWELYQQHRNKAVPTGPVAGRATPPPRPQSRTRWSGRRT
ncbi:hypothetical protein BH10PSE1_BH10PSE1_23750 [soil metagenome]